MAAPALDLKAFLAAQERKSLLRFLTCGSVDDGKSTLIGRLLYDSHLIFEDQLATLEKDSKKHGTTGGDMDFALLVDGLEAEREQGITIDVAYRFFATDKRKFIVADTPGHEQYTRNMATGASNSELAVILIDARKGVLTQTRRHAYIASLLGIRHVVVAVNKIDLVEFSQSIFDSIVDDFDTFAEPLGFATCVPIPISARFGHNVYPLSEQMPWYTGPALMRPPGDGGCGDRAGRQAVPHAGAVGQPPQPRLPGLLRHHLQRSNPRGRSRRGGPVGPDQHGSPHRHQSRRLADASAGEAVTLVLADEIDISRGDILVAAAARPEVSDQFAAHMLWMTEEPLLPGRQYLFKSGAKSMLAQVTSLKHKVDVNTFEQLAAKTLLLNEVGSVNFALGGAHRLRRLRRQPRHRRLHPDRPLHQRHGRGRDDRLRLAPRHQRPLAGAGRRQGARAGDEGAEAGGALVHRPIGLRQVHHRQPGRAGAASRRADTPTSSTATTSGMASIAIWGSPTRTGSRTSGAWGRRAKLFVDAGLIVLVSFISPFRSERRMAR